MRTALLCTFAALLLTACSAPSSSDRQATASPAAAASAGPLDQPDHVVPPMSAAQLASSELHAAVAGSWRSPAQRGRDRYRHPQATLAFFGIRPDMRVIEITPGGGWYAAILAPLLKQNGQYVAAVAAPSSGDYAARQAQSLRTLFAANAAVYGKAQVVAFDPAKPTLGPPASADMVLTFRNVHNWVQGGYAEAMFDAFYRVLKPGGVLGVVDHRAANGASLDDTKGSGYLPEDYVIGLATDAGFRLQATSEVNANPKDTRDYPKGVWTLPPTLTLGDKDKSTYEAIGESDRMTLRFVKPDDAAVPAAAGTAR